ncbi:MAG TPA: hypothetical protein VFI65_19225 [Streptosporangiaceae bacterium]|nr:hypothetical protein [Streptosporangiaceae bacterium]
MVLKRWRDYVVGRELAGLEVDREASRLSQPDWERHWGAPSPEQLRDDVLAALDAHGALDPASAVKFTDIASFEPLRDWARAVLAGAISVDASARFVADATSARPSMRVYYTNAETFDTDGADPESAQFYVDAAQSEAGGFADLLTPFATATGGDWQPRALRSSGSRSSSGSELIVEFEHAGLDHRWELPQDWTDGAGTNSFLDRVCAFALEHLAGRFVIRQLGSEDMEVVYAPGGPVDAVQAILRRWPSPGQLVAMVHQSGGADDAWPERGGNRLVKARERLGVDKPDYGARTADGRLPLNEAAALGNYRAVRGLIYDGADPDLLDGDGRRAIDVTQERAIHDLLAAWTSR